MEFPQKKKKQEMGHEQQPREQTYDSHTNSSVDDKSLLCQISDTLKLLSPLLNPFWNEVFSLEKSADKIGKMLQEKDETHARQISTYSNHETFASKHKSEGFIVRSSSSDGEFYGIYARNILLPFKA